MFIEVAERADCASNDLSYLLDAVRSGKVSLTRLKNMMATSRSLEAKVAALQTDLARSIALRERHGDGGASVLCDQGGKSRSQARRCLNTAEALDEMPQVRSAVDAGEMSLTNAERLAHTAKRTAPEAVDAAADLLAKARELPPDRFAREADAWTQHHQADHGHDDYLRQRRQRYLRVRKDGDKVRIEGQYDLEAGTRIGSRLQRLAEALRRQDDQAARACVGAGADDGRRTWDQLQADALDQLASGAESSGRKDPGGGPNAEVIVVADIGVLTGDNPEGRCEIPGVGPVPPAVLERIACDAHLTGILFHKGRPLYHGATVRTATRDQRRALIARDGGCIGCGAEPRWCQAHHTVPFAQSRRTDIDQLVLVCWRCHHNIHDYNWRVTLTGGGLRVLEPPDPLAPPSPADSHHSSHKHPPRPDRAPQQPRTRAGPAPPSPRTSLPRAPALFPT